jgi:hypothetical protein
MKKDEMHVKKIIARKNEKVANQANQEDEKTECFGFYEVDNLYC